MAKPTGWSFFNAPGSTASSGGLNRINPRTFGGTANSIPAIDQIGLGETLANTITPPTGATSAMAGRQPFVDKIMGMTDIEFKKMMERLGRRSKII